MVQNSFHPAWMRQMGKPLPRLEFCWNWPGNAIPLGNRFGQQFSKKMGGARRAPPGMNDLT
jgi:hypothetical protein